MRTRIASRRLDYADVYRLAEEGITQQAIANELGISQPTVSRILHATDCPTCGEPITSKARRLCRNCWLAEVTKR